jgi:hypothetical protein
VFSKNLCELILEFPPICPLQVRQEAAVPGEIRHFRIKLSLSRTDLGENIIPEVDA